jgi:hypothetical protein
MRDKITIAALILSKGDIYMYDISKQMELLMQTEKSEIKNHSITIGGIPVCVVCGCEWIPSVDHLFECLRQVYNEGVDFLRDGYKLQMSWNFYIFRKYEEGFRIEIPDYTSDPFNHFITDISPAMLVEFKQSRFRLAADVPPDYNFENISFQDSMLVHKDAMNCGDVYVHHVDETEHGKSGWFMGLLDDHADNAEENLRQIRTYELIKKKSDIIGILPFPRGCIAVVKNNHVVELVDGNDSVLFSL